MLYTLFRKGRNEDRLKPKTITESKGVSEKMYFELQTVEKRNVVGNFA